MTTARFKVLFVAIFYSLALLGNSGDIDFEKLKFNLPQKSVTQEIKGSAFVFSFSEKGDGGQFYLSAKGGRDHSQGLLATSLSYSEKEEIISIKKADGSSFLFNGIFVKPGGEQVLIQTFLDGAVVSAPKSISGHAKGEMLRFAGIRVDEVQISSSDMLELALDDFQIEEFQKRDLEFKSTTTLSSPTPAVTVENNPQVYELEMQIKENPEVGQILAKLELDAIAQSVGANRQDLEIDFLDGNEISELGIRPVYLSSDKTTIRVEDPGAFNCLNKDVLAFSLLAKSRDLGQEQFINIQVSLLEINDQAPVIAANQSCSVQILEELNDPFSLCKLTAKDDDTQIASLKYWSIAKSDLPEGIIKIDDHGSLRVANPGALSEMPAGDYRLWVNVSDGDNLSRSAVVMLQVLPKPEIKIQKWPFADESVIEEEEEDDTRMRSMPSLSAKMIRIEPKHKVTAAVQKSIDLREVIATLQSIDL